MTSEHCNVTDGFSDRDRELLVMFDMTEEQVREAEMIAESETIPDGLVGPVYYGRHHTDASRQIPRLSAGREDCIRHLPRGS